MRDFLKWPHSSLFSWESAKRACFSCKHTKRIQSEEGERTVFRKASRVCVCALELNFRIHREKFLIIFTDQIRNKVLSKPGYVCVSRFCESRAIFRAEHSFQVQKNKNQASSLCRWAFPCIFIFSSSSFFFRFLLNLWAWRNSSGLAERDY